jgi:GDP-D-mannose dehydratase
VDALGTLNLLESIRLAGLEKTTRFYQARRLSAPPRLRHAF